MAMTKKREEHEREVRALERELRRLDALVAGYLQTKEVTRWIADYRVVLERRLSRATQDPCKRS